MAIMKCEECGYDVSTKAATCPKCGAPAPTDADYEMLQSRLKKEQEEHEAEKRRQKEKREKKRLEEERKKKEEAESKRREAEEREAEKRRQKEIINKQKRKIRLIAFCILVASMVLVPLFFSWQEENINDDFAVVWFGVAYKILVFTFFGAIIVLVFPGLRRVISAIVAAFGLVFIFTVGSPEEERKWIIERPQREAKRAEERAAEQRNKAATRASEKVTERRKKAAKQKSVAYPQIIEVADCTLTLWSGDGDYRGKKLILEKDGDEVFAAGDNLSSHHIDLMNVYCPGMSILAKAGLGL